jgi:hypothetical protein
MLTAEHSSGGQGFQSDVEIRLMIESYAMAICKEYYSRKGYSVKDVSRTHPYDFVITKNGLSRLKSRELNLQGMPYPDEK